MSRWSSKVRASDHPPPGAVDEKDGDGTVFGVNGLEFVLIAVIAVFVLGPDRMPEYAAKLAHGIRKLRVMAEGAKDQLKDQLGPEYEDINWRQYDPRQYDPRRIVKEALLDPLDDAIAPIRGEIDSVRGAAGGSGAAAAAGGAVAAGVAATDGGPATYSTTVGTTTTAPAAAEPASTVPRTPRCSSMRAAGTRPARCPGTSTRPERSATGGGEPERAAGEAAGSRAQALGDAAQGDRGGGVGLTEHDRHPLVGTDRAGGCRAGSGRAAARRSRSRGSATRRPPGRRRSRRSPGGCRRAARASSCSR